MGESENSRQQIIAMVSSKANEWEVSGWGVRGGEDVRCTV